eukprot:scaffold213996_cov39-Prasinocladus_malaysianus.AAC.2
MGSRRRGFAQVFAQAQSLAVMSSFEAQHNSSARAVCCRPCDCCCYYIGCIRLIDRLVNWEQPKLSTRPCGESCVSVLPPKAMSIVFVLLSTLLNWSVRHGREWPAHSFSCD